MSDVKTIVFAAVPVVVGVLAAGYLLSKFGDQPVLQDVRAGFN